MKVKKTARIILAYLEEDGETPDQALLDEGQNFTKLFRDFTKQDTAYACAEAKETTQLTAADRRAIKNWKNFGDFVTSRGVKILAKEEYYVGGC